MAASPKPVVLIVEDELLIRMMAADGFVDRGFAVLEAKDADDALVIYGTSAPIDVLFTDVNMPGAMNGIDLAEELRRRSPGLCMIITSALPILRPVDHLPATFFAKPYDISSVCDAARRLLS